MSVFVPPLALDTAGHVCAQSAGLGHTTFPSSGAERAQEAFFGGVLLLHSFEYVRAADAFREAQRIDPSSSSCTGARR